MKLVKLFAESVGLGYSHFQASCSPAGSYVGSVGHSFRGPTSWGKEGKSPLGVPTTFPIHTRSHCRAQCGHLSGKVVVPTNAHISRLVAARFQLDLLQHTMLLIARTDAESARLLSSTVDARDHPYIRGVPTCLPDGSRRLARAEVLDRAEAEGRSGAEIDNLEAKWLSDVKLTTFDEGKFIHCLAGAVPLEPTRSHVPY
jgi:Isocitrate lyase family